MEKQAYECKSCGTIIFLKEKGSLSPWCPLCRGGMVSVRLEEKDLSLFSCPKCKAEFFMRKDERPYKCVRCNFTFLHSPRRFYEERL